MITFDRYVKPDKLKVDTFKEFNKSSSTELSKQLKLFKYILDSLDKEKIDNIDKQHFLAIYNAINKENFDIATKATREEKAILSYAGLSYGKRIELLAILASNIRDYMIKACVSWEENFVCKQKSNTILVFTLDKRDNTSRCKVYTWEQRFHPVLAQSVIGIQTLYNRATALILTYINGTYSDKSRLEAKAIEIDTDTMNKLVNAETIEEKVVKGNKGINYITDKIYDNSNELIGYIVEARVKSSKSNLGYITTFKGTVTKEELKKQIKKYPNRYINATLTSDNRIIIKKKISK